MVDRPPVSIIINTDGRAASLSSTLKSLGYLRYPRFEVVVVTGPTTDGTHALLETWQDRIKIGHCPTRNLSQSRNIGLVISSGEIVAFIDDDAVPEPEWLDDVIPSFSDPGVGAAGGFVHNHTGKGYQFRFETTNRFGAATSQQRATPEFNFPYSFDIPSLVGTNSFFRRNAIIDVGGFDEEFEYYLDETDIICRIVDCGWRVAQLDRGFVHHKYLPSSLRNEHRVITSWYPSIKSKAYFAVINGRSHASMQRILTEVNNYVDWARRDIRWAIENGLVAPELARQFERDADQAMRDGLMRGMRGKRRTVGAASLIGDPARFLLFPRLSTAVERQQCFVFLSSNYPPEPLGGIGRYVHLLARQIAGHGHQVHLLTKGQGHDRIDFEDGVWVHRCVVREFVQPQPGPGTDQPIPSHIWNYSMTMLAEAKEIASRRPLHCVHAPIWDVEAIAFLRDGSFPLITSLHTTLAMHLDSGSGHRHDANFTTAFIEPVLAAEKELLTRSNGVLANSEAIIREIEHAYGLRFAPERLRVVPRGLEDWTRLPAELPDPIGSEMARVAFVGRLEPRKGIDVLMRIVRDLLDRYAKLWLDIVGCDLIAGPSGRTWREVFEAHLGGHPGRDRVAFHGAVSEERLRGFYRTADIVVAPSRFESFGLVHLEAMMFGRAVVGCRIGGMPEVITDGRTGLLAQPGDETSLRDCLDRLLENPDLRRRLGKAARGEYLARFGAARMAAEEENFLLAVASRADRRNVHPSLAPTAIRNSAPSSERTGGPPRIAIIGGIVARYDAISEDIVNTWRYLREETGWHVSILATGSDYEGVPVKIVGGVAELLMAAEFLSADVLLYHFGIWNPVFDALPVGNGRARQAVFFHNITPPEFVPPKSRSDIERSFAQLHNLRYADCLWPVSRVNYELLQELHFEPDRMDILPGAVPGPALTRLADKLPVPIEVLCLGRIVPSKGVRDLVAAVALIHKRSLPPFRVKIAGNLAFSDKNYYDLVRDDIIGQGLTDTIELLGTVTPAKRDRLLHAAHIVALPSYHEGFCKPAIEGLRAGCVPIGYAAYNLRYIADGLCRMVMPGDITGLANALADTISGIAAVLIDPAAQVQLDRGMSTAAEFDVTARELVDQFSAKRIAAATRLRVGQLLRMRVPSKSSSTHSKLHRIVGRYTANDVRLLTQIGRREKNRICVDGSSAGTALYGPYVPLAPGNYEATIRFDPAVAPMGFATIDVCADQGREVLAVQTITAEQLCDQGLSASLVFSSAHSMPNVEVRLSCSTGFVAAIQSVEICGELIRSPYVDDFKLTDLPEIRVQNRISRGRNSYEGYQRGIGLTLPEVVTKIKMDPDFQQARELAGDRTIVSENNLFNIFLLIKFFAPHLPTAHVVEFGSFRGGSAIFMSFLAQKFLPKAQVLSFDTFAGMPATDNIIDFHNEGDFHGVDLEELQQYIKQIGLRNLKFVQGSFEETASFTLKGICRVSLCHIDCDIRSAIQSAYDATKPYMVPGGYWVFDDPLLATCLGATEAVEDLLIRRDALNAEQVSPQLVFREPFEKALPG